MLMLPRDFGYEVSFPGCQRLPDRENPRRQPRFALVEDLERVNFDKVCRRGSQKVLEINVSFLRQMGFISWGVRKVLKQRCQHRAKRAFVHG